MPSWLLQRGCLHRADAWKADGSAHFAGHIKDKTARALTLASAAHDWQAKDGSGRYWCGSFVNGR